MIVPPFNSCDEEGYLFIYSFNDEYCAKAGRTVLYIEGGLGPYRWTFNSYTITFNGDDGDAPDNRMWNETDPSGYLSIQDNRLDFSSSDLVTYECYLESINETILSGDFDLQIDFEALTTERPYRNMHYMILQVVEKVGGVETHNWGMMWDHYRYGSEEWRWFQDRGLAGADNGRNTYTGVYKGELRVKRVDDTFYAYYKADGDADFTLFKTFDVVSSEDLMIRLVLGKTDDHYDPIQYQMWNLYNADSVFVLTFSDYFHFVTSETVEQYNFITCADDTPMYSEETVYVTDACGSEVSHKIVCCDPVPCCTKTDYAFSYSGEDPISIDMNYERVELDGGCPPYHWEITGTTYSLSREWTNAPNNVLYRNVPKGSGSSEVLTVTDECGTVVNVDVLGCCDDPTYSFGFDPANDYSSSGGSITISVLGGCPPFTWIVEAPNYVADVVTSSRTNTVYFGGSKAVSTIKVFDACSGISAAVGASAIIHRVYDCEGVVYTEPYMSGLTSLVVDQGGDTYISVYGGSAPFEWTILHADSGLSLDDPSAIGRSNTVSASAVACGTIAVRCTDICGNYVEFPVRCSADSHWTLHTHTGLSIVKDRWGSGWDCICGQWSDMYGCHTSRSVTWIGSFSDYCGVLCDYSTGLYYVESTSELFWVVPTTYADAKGNLLNMCNVNNGACEDSPNDWTEWNQTIADAAFSGLHPIISPAALCENLGSIVRGNEITCGFGSCNCMEDRVGINGVMAYKWVCN